MNELLLLDGNVNGNVGLHTISNLGISFLFGITILLIYVISNRHRRLDDSLTEVIPLLTVLMSVMMHIDNSVQAVTFFGIFGVLSIVRFRSALTDQKGITFILFSVIIGVLVGTKQYTLSVVAFAVLSAIVLTIPHLLPVREFFLVHCTFWDDHVARKQAVLDFVQDNSLRAKVISTRGESAHRVGGKQKHPVVELELEIRRPRTTDLVDVYTRFNQFASKSNMHIVIIDHTRRMK